MSETMMRIFSTAAVLLLVMDPGGNLPVFVALLRRESPSRYSWIVLRESLIAFAVLAIFLFFGDGFLKLLQVSRQSLGIAGGVILFLISLKMVFGAPILYPENEEERPLFIVPLAIPLLAGPSAITAVILLRSSVPVVVAAPALLAAWIVCTGILCCGRWLERLLGAKVLSALESLMGFALAIVAIEMVIRGVRLVLTPLSV